VRVYRTSTSCVCVHWRLSLAVSSGWRVGGIIPKRSLVRTHLGDLLRAFEFLEDPCRRCQLCFVFCNICPAEWDGCRFNTMAESRPSCGLGLVTIPLPAVRCVVTPPRAESLRGSQPPRRRAGSLAQQICLVDRLGLGYRAAGGWLALIARVAWELIKSLGGGAPWAEWGWWGAVPWGVKWDGQPRSPRTVSAHPRKRLRRSDANSTRSPLLQFKQPTHKRHVKSVPAQPIFAGWVVRVWEGQGQGPPQPSLGKASQSGIPITGPAMI